MIAAADWPDQLRGLAFRFSAYGIGPELAGLTLADAWGLFLFLRRLAGGGAAGAAPPAAVDDCGAAPAIGPASHPRSCHVDQAR